MTRERQVAAFGKTANLLMQRQRLGLRAPNGASAKVRFACPLAGVPGASLVRRLFFGTPAMHSPENLFPFEQEIWAKTIARLQFSQQHARVAECLFHGMIDKQIATEMGLSIHTVRIYLRRMARPLKAQGRTELMLRIVAVAQQVQRDHS